MLKSKNHFLLFFCLLLILFLILFSLQLPGINNPALTSSSFSGDFGYFSSKLSGSVPEKAAYIGADDYAEDHEEYIVVSGDTLWAIARQRGCNSSDTRELVYRIMEYNEMSRADLTPGDRLLLPADLR